MGSGACHGGRPSIDVSLQDICWWLCSVTSMDGRPHDVQCLRRNADSLCLLSILRPHCFVRTLQHSALLHDTITCLSKHMGWGHMASRPEVHTNIHTRRCSRHGCAHTCQAQCAHPTHCGTAECCAHLRNPPRPGHITTQVATWHKMFSREVRLREAMKHIIAVMWSHDVPPAATGYTANDIIIGIESGEATTGVGATFKWHGSSLGYNESPRSLVLPIVVLSVGSSFKVYTIVTLLCIPCGGLISIVF